MELFLPSLLVFILAIGAVFAIVPRMSPLILTVAALVLLILGVYQHWKTFAAEYRTATWAETLKLYSPGIFIGVAMLFIIITIMSVFGGGAVPVPSMPNLSAQPTAESATNVVTGALNTATNAVSNVTDAVVNAAGNAVNVVTNVAGAAANAVANAAGAATGAVAAAVAPKNNANKKQNVSRSFFEVV